ncbi:hypothetical protein DH2020_003626 [Rehmannia glutinosa]|uniref:Retrotransposon gag domain-containing protein n=1 Tax=Rehmannia glutinosa TaxID=99300 RepID=A0ABR0XM63_REHGL
MLAHPTVVNKLGVSASFKALQWFQWISRNRQVITWEQFVRALETRFGPSEFEDVQGILSKLLQNSSVEEYIRQFEDLSLRTVGLPPSFHLSCFVVGLRPDLQAEVRAARPTSVIQAMSLTRLHEAKLDDQRRFSSSWRPRGPVEPSQHFTVAVGNGERLSCVGCVRRAKLDIRGHQVCLILYVLPLEGSDVVLEFLGSQLLVPSFELCGINYEIRANGLEVTLGDCTPSISEVPYSGLCKLQSNGSVATYLSLSACHRRSSHRC